MLVKKLGQDAGLQCTWDTEPPTAKVCPAGLGSKTSNFCWKTTGMRYPTAPRALKTSPWAPVTHLRGSPSNTALKMHNTQY